MAVKHRCGRCLTVLRPDGTCPNENCVRYEPPKDEGVTNSAKADESTKDTKAEG